MSSANRKNADNRHVSDYYITPVSEIVKFINQIVVCEPTIFQGPILDPCAGGDPNHEFMAYPSALQQVGNQAALTTMDIRDDSLAEIKGDYLQYNCADYFNLIMSNPPFFLAEQIIAKALNDVCEGGFVVMLLRLNFFGGKARYHSLWNQPGKIPKYCFVHAKRMSFHDERGTDSIEYGHFVWQKGHNAEATMTMIVAP